MEKYVIMGIILILTLPLWVYGRLWLKKQGEKTSVKKQKNIIRQPTFYFYVGISGMILFLTFALFFMFAPDNLIVDSELEMRIFAFIFFLALFISFSFLSLLQKNWKIEIGKDEFIFTNTFRKKRKYKFNEIEVRLLSRSTCYYFKGKKIVSVSYLQENWNALENAIAFYHEYENKKR